MRRGAVIALGLVAVVSATPAMAAPCPPTARVTGDAAADVKVSLARLGVLAPRAGCPYVSASVSRDETAFRVELEGASRMVSTPEVAAAWIDTHARHDVEGDLLGGPPMAQRSERMWLRARGETAMTGDRSAWQSVAVGACAHLGPLCLGASGRWAVNPDAQQTSGGVMATVAAPFRIGRLTFAPEIGVGGGRFVSPARRVDPVWDTGWDDSYEDLEDADDDGLDDDDDDDDGSDGDGSDGDGDGSDGDGSDGDGDGDGRALGTYQAQPRPASTESHATLRAEAGLSIALTVMDQLSVEVKASLEAVPGAAAGEPDRFFRAGLGLRWDAMTGRLLSLRRAEGTADALSDEALVAACGVGDTGALGALFDRHHPAVFRFLSRLTRGLAQDMDDLAQTTFLEVWRSAGNYSGRSAVRTWILGIAANLARHHGRDEARRRDAHRGFASTASTTSRTRPDEQALRQQLVERVGEELERLGHDHRVAFVMCDLEGLSGVEAARALDIREGTLWRRLHEARKALRHVLGGES